MNQFILFTITLLALMFRVIYVKKNKKKFFNDR